MSSSIFNISSWSNSAVYNKHDIIVYIDNRYYYAKAGVPANNPPVYSSVISNSDVYWGGYFQHPVIKKDYPLFIWRPSYQTQANFEPKVSVIKYGDGYEKRVSDQINFNLLNSPLILLTSKLANASNIIFILSNILLILLSFIFLPPFYRLIV